MSLSLLASDEEDKSRFQEKSYCETVFGATPFSGYYFLASGAHWRAKEFAKSASSVIVSIVRKQTCRSLERCDRWVEESHERFERAGIFIGTSRSFNRANVRTQTGRITNTFFKVSTRSIRNIPSVAYRFILTCARCIMLEYWNDLTAPQDFFHHASLCYLQTREIEVSRCKFPLSFKFHEILSPTSRASGVSSQLFTRRF